MRPVITTRIRTPLAFLGAILLLLVAQAATAGQIVMLNGDVITGEIKKIWDDKLTIEPAYTDDFEVDLDAVAYLESEREFDITFPDGRETKAKMLGGKDGTQIIEMDGVTQEIPVMQLAELEEPEDHFDWDSFIDLNSVINTGNTDSKQVTLQGNTNLKIGDHRHIADLSFAREEQTGVTTKEQDRASYSYNWSFNEPWFLGLNTSAERDPIRDLEHRINVGGGVGYNIWDSAGRFFQVQAIAGYRLEKFTAIESNDSAIGGWVLRFKYEVINDLVVFHNHTASTTLSGRDNEVFQSQTGVRYEITDLLYLNFQFDYDYESSPAPGVEGTDTTMLVGLGVEL